MAEINREKVIEELEDSRRLTAPQINAKYHRIRLELMIKGIEDALDLLKEQEPVKPYLDFDGHDVWMCGNCHSAIYHIEHTQADNDAKNYALFCRHCGKPVKWE